LVRARRGGSRGSVEGGDVRSASRRLWDCYKQTGAQRLRDQLIVQYSPLVRHVAGRVSVGLPHTIELADLVSYGMFGLIDAIEKFDVARNTRFEPYAVTRIRGAIIDELRSIDWVPRSVRAKARAVEDAHATLAGRLQRTPTDAEVAAELRISVVDLHEVLTRISLTGVVTLDEAIAGRRGRPDVATLGDILADRTDGPMAAYELAETRQVLVSAIDALGQREKLVLALYYDDGLTLAEVGHVIGVTESRICQIHAKAVVRLRELMMLATRESA
jgi:RNA polymerase sigma factor for flagellar operon FliA